MCVLHVQPIILLVLVALQFKCTSDDSPRYTIFSAFSSVPTYPRLLYGTERVFSYKLSTDQAILVMEVRVSLL